MIGGFCDGNLWDFHESFGGRRSKNRSMQMHSSLIQRLRQEEELEINVWNYPGLTLLHSIETGHFGNIFCTKFIPESSDELVASEAGDAEVEDGNPNVMWSASEDGNLWQHDLREVVNCVQCHPLDCVVVTSGIDNTIKIWTPTAPAPSMAAVPNGHCICVDDAIDNNQCRLTSNREIILPFEILERFRMQELAEGNMHAFECMQT